MAPALTWRVLRRRAFHEASFNKDILVVQFGRRRLWYCRTWASGGQVMRSRLVREIVAPVPQGARP